MPLTNPLAQLPLVEETDVLNVGRTKINSNTDTIRLFSNALRQYVLNLTPQQINGLLSSGRINPNLLQGVLGASDISIQDTGNNFDATNVEAALAELISIVDSIVAGGGSGDVIGPASSANNRIALFQGSSGKVIQDSGVLISQLATATQGALAQTAVQPEQLSQVATTGNYNHLVNLPGTAGSVTLVDGNYQLVGDSAAPGNNKIYGTDSSGIKTWRDAPAGGGGGGIPNLDGGGAGTNYGIIETLDGGNAASTYE